MAISGLNVGLIAGFVLAIFAVLSIPRKLSLALTTVFLAFYSFVAGSNPPIMRAVIMFSALAIGYLIDRDADPLNTISLAAILMLLFNPRELFDPSFQLSFVSVASILVFAPRINRIFGLENMNRESRISRMKTYVFKGTIVSIAAWLGTWPLIVYYFNIISPIALIANLIVVPILFILTGASLVFFPINLLSTLCASAIAHCLYLIEMALFSITHYLSDIPLAYFRAGIPSVGLILLYYALLSLLTIPPEMEFKKLIIKRRGVLLIILLISNILVWRGIINSRERHLKVNFLDVGNGDSIFIEFPNGGNLLIDAGPGGEGRFDAGRSIIAPCLWNKGISTIGTIILTHFHEDHVGGLTYLLKNFKVDCVIDNGAHRYGNSTYDEYRKAIRDGRIRHIEVREGDVIIPSRDIRLFVLNPERDKNLSERGGPEANDDSIVLKLFYKDSSILFCGDVTGAAISRLTSYGDFLKSDIIKIPHHGGHIGSSITVKKFLRAVSPKISVVSVGRMYHHNIPVKRNSDIPTSIIPRSYETRNSGAITISLDSKSYSIKRSREGQN